MNATSLLLSEKHLADLRASGLSDEQIAACGFRSIHDASDVATALRCKSATKLGSCLLLPYRRADGSLIPVTEFARIKPDTPRTNRKPDKSSGKAIKYESPRGSTPKLYFPPRTCRLLADVSVPLLVTEGEKKSAKADQEGIACIGLGGVDAWSRKRSTSTDGKKHGKRKLIADFDDVALNGREVFIVFDSDIAEKGGVQWAEWNLAQALSERGAIVKVVRLPHGSQDANGEPIKIGLDDYLVAHSADDFRELLKAALLPTKPSRCDNRIRIVISTDEANVNDQTIRALANDERVFQRAGKLVHVVTGAAHDDINRPEDAPRVSPIPLALLRECLTRVAQFVTEHDSKKGERELKPAHPPQWCYEAIAARGQWQEIRSLVGIVTAPVLRPDGSVLNSSGFDPATGLLLIPQGGVFPIIDKLTHGDALRAVAVLLDLVSEFPFSNGGHRAAWLAFLLTALARFAFTGPAPLFLIDANVRGSGKSFLCDVVSLIVTGREMPRMANPKEDDEARKRITAVALAGDTFCMIDNVVGGLGSAALDAALTATVWKDRVLSKSEMTGELPLSVTWCATGNNVVLIGDTSRRVAHIRLESQLENPEQREGFQYPNLKDYVRQHRRELLAAALTVLAAYCKAGRPQQKLPTWGSFEGWSDLIRQAVVWCGQPDPGATRTELVEHSDREAIALRDLLVGWDELDPDCTGLTAAEILERLTQHPERYHQVRDSILELCPAPAGKLPSSRSVGSKLSHLRNRFVGGRCLDFRPVRGNRKAWQVTGETPNGYSGCSGYSSPALPTREEDTNENSIQYGAGTEKDYSDQPEQPKPCGYCGSGRLWRSHHGPHLICGECHAPPTPNHVAEWIEVAPGLSLTQRRCQ